MSIYNYDGNVPELPISEDYWIAPGAHVIGKVRIGPRCGIWFGAVLRGDNEFIIVGSGTNIQENSVLHTDLGHQLEIGENCTIGHSAIIHGCKIGDNSLIGMGAVILNGAKIGKNCLIAAGALIKEGSQVPDNSLVVGMPGKVIREIDDIGVEKLRISAVEYQTKMRKFKENLNIVK
ncbi:gamma carbonic anhydrase family protein [Amylibacter sp.]|nr:gamma carbonic anhydrase family protein [Amylibacter sp.]MDB4117639.1 gamma carbonic anhydrase family protein [Amylibacter sp.]MDB4179381.1 gamma carbonic anhydrase family protein [Amylibacter sp.]MDB4190723.1 gamma carbonic anhydrase family protein [Amylibacter sp.]MDB9763460.1 gamma carbonic anhydrase family protein [Amylibacter sp.]